MPPINPGFANQHSGAIKGSLNNGVNGSDVDHFSLNAAAQEKITLALTSAAANAGASMELLDADGPVLVSSQTGTLHFYPRAAGTFYVRAAPPASGASMLHADTGANSFAEHEPSDPFDDANSFWLTGIKEDIAIKQ